MEKKPLQFKRVTVYIDTTEYRVLKSKLALQGLSVSEWARKQIQKEITN
jgi:hypothetical protein